MIADKQRMKEYIRLRNKPEIANQIIEGLLDNPEREYPLEFIQAVLFTIDYEKGYVNNPNDPGGATKWGISMPYALSKGLKFDKNQDGKLDKEDIKLLSAGDAFETYYFEFWLPYKCFLYPFPMNICLFDSLVMMNPKRPIQWAESSQNHREFLEKRVNYHLEVANRNPKFKQKTPKYSILDGWINRVNDLKKYIDL